MIIKTLQPLNLGINRAAKFAADVNKQIERPVVVIGVVPGGMATVTHDPFLL